jgi:hypothetical protein
VPRTTTLPSPRKAIEFTFFIVFSRCATTIVALPDIIRSRASCTTCSDCASSALVASSGRRIAGFRIIALAIAILCFCPPESCVPCSPQSASHPSFKDLKISRFGVGYVVWSGVRLCHVCNAYIFLFLIGQIIRLTR